MSIVSLQLPVQRHDSPPFEVVDGKIVECPMGAFDTNLATILVISLGTFARERGLGRAVSETLFAMRPETQTKRRPDVAFVSYDRWPKNRRVPRQEGWEVVPDLAAEVVSASNIAEDMIAKVGEYFEAGVRLVWVIYPAQEKVYAYASPTNVKVLTRSDELEGGDVLPGYRLPLATLFEDGVD